MKNTISSILFILLLNNVLEAQNYYYFRTNGDLPSGYDINKVNDSDNIRKILIPKTNDVLSSVQSFPFPFRFNGSYYANYKVSDNGYLTFNTGSSISYKPDSNFTNRALLKNAIVPFWYDFEVKKLPYPNQDFNVKIFAYTKGRYPNRTHTIQYYGISKASDTLSAFITNANVFAFAVVLHEGSEGRFDIIYNYFGKNNITGLSGCTDNSNNFTLIKDKPIAYPVATSSALINTIVYQFFPGKAPSKKLYLRENIIENQYKVNVPVIIKSTITNLGSDTVFNLKYVYLVNSTDTFTDLINLKNTGQYLLPKGENTITFNASLPWSSGSAGSINTIKTMALLDQDSLNNDSNSFSKTSKALRILGLKPIARNTMLEISTGGWCGYCTSSHLVAESLKKTLNNRLIPVMHHFGDPMETVESNKINQAYEKGFPYGIINRKVFSGQSSGWTNIINIEKQDSSNVKVSIINKSYDEQSRTITFKLNVKSFDYLYGNYRIGAFITEDNVRGNASPSQWSQSNFNSKQYGATDSANPLYYEWRYMDGYLHQYVVLNTPLGAWGKANSLPDLMKPGDEYTFDVSYVLPATTTVDYSIENNTKYCSTKDGPGENEGMFKPLDISLIGFVAEYDSTDIYKRIIINAVSNKLLFDNTAVNPVSQSKHLTIFPNPANASFSFLCPFTDCSNCTIELYNSMGILEAVQTIQSVDSLFTCNSQNLKEGFHTVRITTASGIITQKIIISR